LEKEHQIYPSVIRALQLGVIKLDSSTVEDENKEAVLDLKSLENLI